LSEIINTTRSERKQ